MKSVLAVIFSLLFIDPVSVSIEKWVIDNKSSLSIEGKTNVSTFKCDIVEYLNHDTILLYKDHEDQKLITAKGGLTININRFNCKDNHITSDLKKALKADDNAFMKINFLTLGYIKQNTTNQTVKGQVEILLAGITKKIEIDYTVLKNQDGFLHLIGNATLLFSDFKLIPPRKLAGLIKVEQEIKVQFKLMLRSVL